MGDVMVVQLKMIPAVIFYVLFLAEVIIFAISPALPVQTWLLASGLAVVLGVIAYANYDFTHFALLKDWSLSLSLNDILGGALIIFCSAAAGFYVAQLYT